MGATSAKPTPFRQVPHVLSIGQDVAGIPPIDGVSGVLLLRAQRLPAGDAVITVPAGLPSAKRPSPLPRTPWERGLGSRVPQGAARPVHPLGSLLGRPLSALLLGTCAPALTRSMASIPPIRSRTGSVTAWAPLWSGQPSVARPSLLWLSLQGSWATTEIVKTPATRLAVSTLPLHAPPSHAPVPGPPPCVVAL
jgi:hypothetical protein